MWAESGTDPALEGALTLVCAPFTGTKCSILAMCNPEEEALLRLEEVFSATLARINSLVLQPLLTAGESQLCSGEGGGCRDHPWDPGPILLDLSRHTQCSQPQTGAGTCCIGIF